VRRLPGDYRRARCLRLELEFKFELELEHSRELKCLERGLDQPGHC
jgi:hypothetical protein